MTLGPDHSALVTGASSGIGEATVRALRAHGVQVHAAARRLERLEDLAADTGCVPHALDVRDRAAVASFGEKHQVDILVNNAGLGRSMGSMWSATADDVDMTVDTNVTGAIHVIRAVLPGMIQRGRGHLVNMSSVMAINAGPAALYGATKGAMHMMCRDLRLELHGTGVRVTEICPGRVDTEFYDVAIDDQAGRDAAITTGAVHLTPADIADAVVYATSAPWRVNVSLLEILPTEQTYGGSHFVPFPDATKE